MFRLLGHHQYCLGRVNHEVATDVNGTVGLECSPFKFPGLRPPSCTVPRLLGCYVSLLSPSQLATGATWDCQWKSHVFLAIRYRAQTGAIRVCRGFGAAWGVKNAQL